MNLSKALSLLPLKLPFTPRRLILLSGAYVLLCLVLNAIAAAVPDTSFAATPWNPQPALSFALLVFGGAWLAPAVLIGTVLSDTLMRPVAGPGAGSILAHIAYAVVYVGAALSLRRFTRERRDWTGARILTVFFSIAVASSFAACALYVLVAIAVGPLELSALPDALVSLWFDDLVGLIVVTPALLMFASGRWNQLSKEARQAGPIRRDALLFVLALAGALALALAIEPIEQFKMFYLLFVPVTAAGLRYGAPGAAFSVLATQLGLALALLLIDAPAATAFEFQLLMLTLASVALYLGTLSSERARAIATVVRREAALRDQQAALNNALRAAAASEMATMLAHELSQPLSALGTYARASKMLAQQPELQRDLLVSTLDKIGAESARAGESIRRMRDFFRSGSQQLETVAPEVLIRTAFDQVRDRCLALELDLRLEIPPGLPEIEVDRVQIVTVLLNLLLNAMDAVNHQTSARKIIVIRCILLERPAAVRIDVEDSGPRISPEGRQQLFGPLSTSKPEGLGLGLAISRSIAERHGGSLWLNTEFTQTVFSLTLPAHE